MKKRSEGKCDLFMMLPIAHFIEGGEAILGTLLNIDSYSNIVHKASQNSPNRRGFQEAGL